MKMHPGVMAAKKVNRSCNLQVHISKKREGLFVLEPVGSINSITSRSLQTIVDRICVSKPHIIMFDLERVDFINSKGLRVILDVYQVINAQGGSVVLKNFQPHIKKVFEIINALPEQRIFASNLEFDNYLEAMQNKFNDLRCRKTSETETGNCIICAEINDRQPAEGPARMTFQ